MSAVPPSSSSSSPGVPLAKLLGHAADALQAVREGRSLTDVLDRTPAEVRAGTQALAFQVLRRLGSAEAVRAALAPKPPPPKVDALLVTALALLWPPEPPDTAPYTDHTLVDQAVHAAHHRTPAAAGFVNAVLRRFIRERDALVAAARTSPLGAYNHPAWWIERVRRDWPTQWQAVLQAADRHPPMTLRVNRRRGDAPGYVQRLAAQGRAATALDDTAVLLAQPCPVQQLPGFAEGDVSVQDVAAQWAAPLLLGRGQAPAQGLAELPPGARVLDACAAPGGKTAHLLELAELDVLALDVDARRLDRVRQNLQRLQLKAELKAGDARDTAAWWDGRPFDAILLDAPCSASGIVRRHPDVRWLRRPDDIAALGRTQAQLLDALWPLLAPGGRLLYATCSVFKAEGQAQIDAFLQRGAAAPPRLDPASPGHLLPLADNAAQAGAAAPVAVADGFYYALLHRP